MSFLLLWFMAWVTPAHAQDSAGTIVSLRVEGNKRIEDAAVLAAVQLNEGEELAAWKIRRDIKGVYRTGFFEDVQVDVVDADVHGGVVVTFLVDENPAVREILLSGNKKLDEDDLREVMDISPYTVLNDSDIALNQQRLRDLYIEKGYFLAEVEPVLADVGDDLVELTFEIVENRKVIVQSIDITGNTGVPDRKIKRFLQTREGGIAPWLTSAGSFNWQNLDADMMIVKSVFLEEGYVDAAVSEPKVYLSPDKRYIYITIHVDEGKRYKLGHIRADGDWVEGEGLTEDAVMELVRGATVKEVQDERDRRFPKLRRVFDYSQETTVAATPLETGDYFKLSEVQLGMQRISDLYADQGYAFVNVYPDTRTDPESELVDITFLVSKGEKVRIGRINITGNDPTWDKVVRREIPINEGEIYNGSQIREARQRLERLGFFEEVRITTPRGAGADVLDMNVDVVEQPTGSFSVGMGFSNLENFVLTGSVSKQNFLGLGYIMNAAINWSSLRQQWNLSFFDPYLLDTRWTLKVDGFSISQQYVEDQYQRGGGLAVGRYLDRRDDWRLTANYTLEDVGLTQISPYQAHLFGGQLYRNGLTSTLGLNLNVDKRDNRIKATKGLYASASTELSGGFRLGETDDVVNLLGGEFMLWENRLNVRWFQPVIPGKDILIFRFNSTLGHIQSTDGSVVPFIHRYRAGGINSVRGYNWYSLGPSIRNLQSDDPTHADDRLIVGGTETFINNIELESPIIKAAGISAVVFFDAGNAFGGVYDEEHINLAGLRYSYGFGVRWFSPIGPLRFEWGFPINPHEDERTSVFDFSIGSFF
ncbi:MAG: outer membrane protein assembly factor BamA [Proteobacteria bacterium]|nr:outer membrane protein assembly factor BamA [Pseudomonadota bacterium]MCP4920683.1 outer membrane protein assembly factor BamA [Pseudomonadota bacterium]